MTTLFALILELFCLPTPCRDRCRYTSAKVITLAFSYDSSLLAASTDFSLHVFGISSSGERPGEDSPSARTHYSSTFDYPSRLLCFWARSGDGERLMAVRGDMTWREYVLPSDGASALVLSKFGRLLKPSPTALFRAK